MDLVLPIRSIVIDGVGEGDSLERFDGFRTTQLERSGYQLVNGLLLVVGLIEEKYPSI
jgi:hypothetical protein